MAVFWIKWGPYLRAITRGGYQLVKNKGYDGLLDSNCLQILSTAWTHGDTKEGKESIGTIGQISLPWHKGKKRVESTYEGAYRRQVKSYREAKVINMCLKDKQQIANSILTLDTALQWRSQTPTVEFFRDLLSTHLSSGSSLSASTIHFQGSLPVFLQ